MIVSPLFSYKYLNRKDLENQLRFESISGRFFFLFSILSNRNVSQTFFRLWMKSAAIVISNRR